MYMVYDEIFIPIFILWTRQMFIIYFYPYLDWLGVITIQWAKKDVKLKTKLFKVIEIFMFCQNHGNYDKLLLIHSYECQIKNLLDEILGLNFDLEHLKVNTYQASKEINFAKDYQKDLYNKTILIGEKYED